MAKHSEKLTALFVRQIQSPGFYSDGLGLALKVSPTLVKSWVFRYERAGSETRLGLGATHTISLAEARAKATELRKLLLDGNDPKIERRNSISKRKVAASRSITFDQAAKKFIAAKSSEWSNPKHKAQWKATLDTYASPVIGNLPIDSIETPSILEILEPIWHEKTETASRVQGRIAKIFDWAIASKHRTESNPAKWVGLLEFTLPSPKKIATKRNQPALPFELMPKFMKLLHTRGGISSKALEFLILTAARPGEVRLATWDEIDLEKKIWEIPSERMKMSRPHVIALCDRCIELLNALPRFKDCALLFPSGRNNKPLSDAALTKLLKDMHAATKEKELLLDPSGAVIVAHGFRSAFKTFATERTSFDKQVVEFALAHGLPDRVEAAYLRSTQFAQRVQLMTEWANYLYEVQK